MNAVNSEFAFTAVDFLLAAEGKQSFNCDFFEGLAFAFLPAYLISSGTLCGFTQISQSTCEDEGATAPADFARMCCCGPNCPVAEPPLP
mmetsp:Transcript_16337/g.43793  ORF Transcript_16337/g.43793 Transcript_16337/m.43793 type:complete len:89 (+) Transcript_16337:413-679(+)